MSYILEIAPGSEPHRRGGRHHHGHHRFAEMVGRRCGMGFKDASGCGFEKGFKRHWRHREMMAAGCAEGKDKDMEGKFAKMDLSGDESSSEKKGHKERHHGKHHERKHHGHHGKHGHRGFLGGMLGSSGDTFKVYVDMKGYEASEVSAKIAEGFLTVTGNHEQNAEDGSCSVSRQFTQRFKVPEEADIEQVKTKIVMHGRILKVEAPLKTQPQAIAVEVVREPTVAADEEVVA